MASSYAQDDGFREIQLNGKQLFFLFMATTVVSVVIFLCGVLVGRGVHAERNAIVDATVDEAPTSDVAPIAAPAQSVASDPIAAVPPPLPRPDDELRPAQIEITAAPGTKADPIKPISAQAAAPKAEAPKAEAPKAAAPKPAAPAPVPAVKAEATPAPKPVPAAKPASPAEAPYVVQVAAVNTQAEADSYVKKMSASGYPVFVSESTAGKLRVRVGPYKGRPAADAVAEKLKRQLNTADIWVAPQ